MQKSADITPDGKYRYSLTRDWSNEGEIVKTVVFVGLNPSTADAEIDDPTIRRCIGFAKTWGYNRLVMVNLFAYRATEPSEMKKAYSPEGLFNLTIVHEQSAAADLTVAAWGTHGTFCNNDQRYLRCLTDPHHLGLSKHGHPKHPLYLKGNVIPQPMEISDANVDG
jgi:hypothetical protein